MLSFPNAKINLGLNVIEKRTDGFHNISSCFYPVGWKEILEVIESSNLEFTSSGLLIPGEERDNLCLKAFNILSKDFQIPNVHIHLHKILPIGAGLGGGSADAAFTLKALNKMFNLYLDDTLLEEYAGKLGSDCAFFIRNKPILALGKGDQFEEISLDLSQKHIVLVYPNIHISTQEAYAGIRPQKPVVPVKEIIEKYDISEWKELLINDFEKSIFPKYPQIQRIKEKLYTEGALYASMTGSGSSVYGIFNQVPDIKSIFPEYSTWTPEK
ncbi:4-(cytidine 5'-diphospho)-2-C-methyl-D-erythritol kinase [Fulvivirgaceae bacterium BMA10]|uniref:4-diphosphocytidyl-2-C-methyl-D-erythritol kinase n=1 Tax=Splendidivirga corallicola TaxID=3051826 RepID=A0ABT8KJP7_9BACT|nr:4-(cytidine 5'-diphospho)-2-C-methyl-D-erythritol kinase [Fulvivirgaceae bacterium BMA10]